MISPESTQGPGQMENSQTQLLSISSKEVGSGYRLLLEGNGPLPSWLSLPMREMETKKTRGRYRESLKRKFGYRTE